MKKTTTRKLMGRLFGAVTGLAAIANTNCGPVGVTPTVPSDLLEGETIEVYEADLQESCKQIPFNLFHGAPAFEYIAQPIVLASTDGNSLGSLGELLNNITNGSAQAPEGPFSARLEPKENGNNIPFVYTEGNLVLCDTTTDYFENGTTYTVWIPTANNFIGNPWKWINVKWSRGHSPEWLTAHPTPGPQGPPGTPGEPGQTNPACTTTTLDDALLRTRADFVDANKVPVQHLTTNNPFTFRYAEDEALPDCYTIGNPLMRFTDVGTNPCVGLTFTNPADVLDHTIVNGTDVYTVRPTLVGEETGADNIVRKVWEVTGDVVSSSCQSSYEEIQADALRTLTNGTIVPYSAPISVE
jgi:hypothetical protein